MGSATIHSNPEPEKKERTGADRRAEPADRDPGGDDQVLLARGFAPSGHDHRVRAVVSLHRFAPAAIPDARQLRPYADAARSLATAEIPSTFDTDIDTDEALRFSVLGTVLFEPVLLALRKLAHVDRIRTVGRDRPPPEEDTRSRPGAPTASLTTSTAPFT